MAGVDRDVDDQQMVGLGLQLDQGDAAMDAVDRPDLMLGQGADMVGRASASARCRR